MRRSTPFIVTHVFLVTLITICNAFTPLEFLQHLQQQQQLQQQQEQVQQPVVINAPADIQQPVQKEPQAHQPDPQENSTKEAFKPFNGVKPLMFKGCFTFTEEPYNEKIPHFRVYFEGKETISDEEGFFSIPVDENKLEKYKLVITKTFQQDFDHHNTIKDLRLFADKNYKCYSFKKRGPFGGMWVQREKDLRKKNFVIPNNAIIVLVDPKYVDHLDPWNIHLANNFIPLPKIVLKKEVKNKPTDRAAAKSLLTSLDAAVFHEEIREEVKEPSAKVKMTLAQ